MMSKLLRVLSILLILNLSACATNKTYEESDVYYEIYVGSFNDSDGDLIGDLNGVSAKLDYLKELGIGGIWLMPISESDTYHKYDVIDYKSIDEDYGTMEDFENLIDNAHEKNMDIIIDLVLNHSSSKNPWFIEASENFKNNDCDKEESKCNYYNFSNENINGYSKLSENVYYESVFWSEMPDLNLDDLQVREEIMDIADFWLEKGVDGFRLDAVYHYYSGNVTKNNAFTKWFNDYVESSKEGAYVVGEVWADENTILTSYESGIDSMFDFPLSGNDGKISHAILNKNGKSLAEYVVEYNNQISELSENSMDAVFLSNHDQARSAGFLIGDEKKKLAASLYLLMPGIPFIYYGEEIGMKGSGIDENKRMAMLWGEDTDCDSPVGYDYSNQITTNVKEELNDETSLLSFYQTVLEVRNKYGIIKDSDLEVYPMNDSSLYAIKYFNSEESIIVITNLSDLLIVDKVEGEYKIDSQIDVMGKSFINEGSLSLQPYSTVVLKN